MLRSSSRIAHRRGPPRRRLAAPLRHRHHRPGPGRAARRAARLGDAAGGAVAGRDGRSARRAHGLPAGLRLSARARRLRPREPGAAHRSLPPRKRLNCWRSCASCATRRAPKRWASVSSQPTSRRRRSRCSTATMASKRWMRSALSRTGWRAARRPASVRTKAAEAALSAHLEVAARYGVKFTNIERDGRMQICYDGDAFRRVLAMRSTAGATRARGAGLHAAGMRRPAPAAGCNATPSTSARAEALERVDVDALPGYVGNRVLMRRAAVWSSARLPACAQGRARGRGGGPRAGGAGRGAIGRS